MLKREITYEDYDGETVTDTFYFNLTKSELVNLEVERGTGGLEGYIRRIVKAEDNNALIKEFQGIILLAFGVKSEDGKRFIKSEQLREEFAQTAAFDALFIEMLSSEDAAANFIKGILPKDMPTGDQDKPATPPVSLAPPKAPEVL